MTVEAAEVLMMTSTLSGSTVAALRRALAAELERAFAEAGREGTAALDARLLLAHALGIDASSLALRGEEPVEAEAESLARGFIERRNAGEPVARILGSREFWGLDLSLGPDTLVPRPDTETVVEAALAFVDGVGWAKAEGRAHAVEYVTRGPGAPHLCPPYEDYEDRSGHDASPNSAHPRRSGDTGAVTTGGARGPGFPLAAGMSGGGEVGGSTSTLHRNQTFRLLDIGTGTGAILLALLSELPNATGIGTDISEAALDVARSNAERLGLASRASFIRSDWAAAVAGPFDLVLSNPPYIRSGDIATLPVEVARHDPHLALDGGTDGLAAYHAILTDLGRLLNAGGKAFLEIGLGQAPQIADLAAKQGFTVLFHRDLAGIERVAEIGRIADG